MYTAGWLRRLEGRGKERRKEDHLVGIVSRRKNLKEK